MEYKMTKTSDAQRRADDKYKRKTYDSITFRVRKDAGSKKEYQNYADKCNLSLQGFIKRCVEYVIANNIKP